MRRLNRRVITRAAGALTIATAVRAYFRSSPREPVPTPAELEAALRQAGVDATVERRTVSGGGAVGWIVTITLAAPLAAFFTAIGSEAGKDAYAAFRAWFRKQRMGTADSAAVIVAGSDDRKLELELGVPDEALDALRGLDWAGMPNGWIAWDGQARRWRIEPDETRFEGWREPS